MYILDCTAAEEMCTNLQPFLNVIKVLLGIVRWTVPIVLIVFGSIDMFKAVTKAEDEKSIQDARRSLIKRIIYGVVVFLVPLIVNIVMELIDEGVTTTDEVTATTWVSCWNNTIDTSKCDDIYAPEVEPETSSENGNTCNCELCENGTSNCQYAKITVGACRAEGGTCKTTPTDDDNHDCSSYVCPSSAKIDSFNKSVNKVYYKNSCYCKVTIADPDIYNSSNCSDIEFSSDNYTFAFYESDGSMANINCYFKKRNNTNDNNDNSSENSCTEPCLRKNLILGREFNGQLSNNICTYSAVLDTDANLDCAQSCKNTWGKSGFKSSSSNSNGGCSCKYSTICN